MPRRSGSRNGSRKYSKQRPKRSSLRQARALHSALMRFLHVPNDKTYGYLQATMESNSKYSPDSFRCESVHGFDLLADIVNLTCKVTYYKRKSAEIYSYEKTVNTLFKLYTTYVPRDIQLEHYLTRCELSHYSPIENASANKEPLIISKMVELSHNLLIEFSSKLGNFQREKFADILMPNLFGYSILYNAFSSCDKQTISSTIKLYEAMLSPAELKKVALGEYDIDLKNFPSFLYKAIEHPDDNVTDMGLRLAFTAFSKDKEYAVEYFLEALHRAIIYGNTYAVEKITEYLHDNKLRIEHKNWYEILSLSFYADDLTIPEYLMKSTFSTKENNPIVLSSNEQHALISKECGYDLLFGAIYCSHDDDERMGEYNRRILNPLITTILDKLESHELATLLRFEKPFTGPYKLPFTVLDMAIQADNIPVAKKLISLIKNLHEQGHMDYYSALENTNQYFIPEKLALFIQESDIEITKFDRKKQQTNTNKPRRNKRKRRDDTDLDQSISSYRDTVFYYQTTTTTTPTYHSTTTIQNEIRQTLK